MNFLYDPTFWVFACFMVLMIVIIRRNGLRMITAKLDQRSAHIKKSLDEARKLRDEAKELLAEYKRKADSAETETKEIMEQAKTNANQLQTETLRNVKEVVERRIKSAKVNIDSYEQKAVQEIKNYAAAVAVDVARELLAQYKPKGNKIVFDDDAIAKIAGELEREDVRQAVKQNVD